MDSRYIFTSKCFGTHLMTMDFRCWQDKSHNVFSRIQAVKTVGLLSRGI